MDIAESVRLGGDPPHAHAAWIAFARRDGPSPEAEGWLRYAFEAALANARGGAADDDETRLRLGPPFTAWFEYLVMFGRFAEACAERKRATEVLGASFFAKPRPWVRQLVEALASTPDVTTSQLRVHRFESAGGLETICVSLPVPLFTGEPLWVAFARVVGTSTVRVFSLDWFAEECAARPASWAERRYLAPRDYGCPIAPGAAPRPDLGAASPYLPPFLAYITQNMASAMREQMPSTPPVSTPPVSTPPVSTPPVSAPAIPVPKRRYLDRVALALFSVSVVASVVLSELLRASHH